MQPESEPGNERAADDIVYLTALLQTHMVARRAIRRLETLCARYPDPALQAAIEALRREEQEWEASPESPHPWQG